MMLLVAFAASGIGSVMLHDASQHRARAASDSSEQRLAETVQHLDNSQEAVLQHQEAMLQMQAAEQKEVQVMRVNQDFLWHNQKAMLQAQQDMAQTQQDMVQQLDRAQQLALNSAAVKTAAATQGDGDEQGMQQVPAAFAALPVLTPLHNQVLQVSRDYEKHRHIMREVLQALVHAEPAQAMELIESRMKASSQGFSRQWPKLEQGMLQFSLQLFKLLLGTGKLVPGREDATFVPNDDALAPHQQDAPAKYYFATNLRDNSNNMPQYILSMLQTLLRLPGDSVFVSAYESNSEDGAHGWVEVLQLALNVIGTPSRLVARGMLVKQEETERIEHLARVRNMALAPLYQHYREAALSASNTAASESSSSSTDSPQEGISSRQKLAEASGPAAAAADPANLAPGVLPWEPDYIVFVNDVFFTAENVLRLLNYRADITCGMDFHQGSNSGRKKRRFRPFRQRHSAATSMPRTHIPEEFRLERPIDAPYTQTDSGSTAVFYDTWVSRDLSGNKMLWSYPFVEDAETRHAATQGLPFRASCCWNGLAVLRAAPFKAGLRVRSAMSNECQASECSLLCDDFARLGFDYVVVDAGVQLSYKWELAQQMSAYGVTGIGLSSWAEAKAAGIAGRHIRPSNMRECCDLRPGKMGVDFDKDCHMEDITAVNFTHAALLGAPGAGFREHRLPQFMPQR